MKARAGNAVGIFRFAVDVDEVRFARQGRRLHGEAGHGGVVIAGNIDVSIVQNDCPEWDKTPANNQKKVNIYKNG